MRKIYVGDDEGRNDEVGKPWTKDTIRNELVQLSVMTDCEIIGNRAVIKVREGYGDGEYLAQGAADLALLKSKSYKTERKNGCTIYYIKIPD